MKQTAKKSFILCAASLLVLLLFSCENPFMALPAPDNGQTFVVTGSLSSKLEGAVPSELVEEHAASGRTALPVMSLSSSLYYSVTATSGTKTVTGTIDTSTFKYTVSLGTGSWTLTVIAYKDAAKTKQILKGTRTLTVTSTGVSENTAIALNGIMDDTTKKSEVTLTISYASTVKKIKTAVYNTDGTPLSTGTSTYNVTGTSDTLTIGELTVGAHPVSFMFFDANDAPLYSFVETVNVFENLVTNTWVNSTGAPYFSGNTVNVSAACINSFRQTTVYVSSSGNDTTGDGQFFSPFATVQKAVDVIASYADTSTTYNIILKSNLTCAATPSKTDPTTTKATYIIANPTATLNLKICSDSSTVRTISANAKGRVMYLGNKANVTLENVKITGGTVAANGGGVYNRGTLTLSTGSSIISNETTSGSGGGIYNTGTLSIGSGVSVSTCTASADGGGIYNSGTATLYSCKVISCSATSGGGIANSSTLYIYGTTAIGGASTAANSATGTATTSGFGGGIYSTGGTVGLGYDASGAADTWSGSISSNSARCGGGISINSGSLLVSTSVSGYIGGSSKGNTATSYGGGIYNASSTAITISKGTISYNSAQSGGGIYNAGTITLSGATISYNTATNTGGGLANNKTMTFSSGTLSNNEAPKGAGIFNLTSQTITISGGTISSNKAISADDSIGGGMYNCGICKLTGGTFKGNQATSGGGGIYSSGSLYISGTATIGGTSANGNSLTDTDAGNGGGLFCSGATRFGYTYDGTTESAAAWSGSVSSNSAAFGGGIYQSAGSLKFSSSVTGTIGGSGKANTASVSGGGIYSKVAVTLEAGTISYNTAESGGGGLYVNGSTTVTISGGTISHNTARTGGGVNAQGAALYMSAGTISSNEASAQGGGIATNSNVFIYNTATIGGAASSAANKATGSTYGQGGGIFASNASGTVYLGYKTASSASEWTGSISGNSAYNSGGGIYCSGTIKMNTGTIGGSSTKANSAKQGGGIYSGGTLEITGGTISYNTAEKYGGGIYSGNSSGDTMSMTAGAVKANSAVNSGGGIYIAYGCAYISGTATIGGTSSTDGNKTTGTSGQGGGATVCESSGCCLYLGYDSSAAVKAWTGSVSYNSSVKGGGVYNRGALYIANGSTTVGSGAIANNTASTAGGAVYLDYQTAKINIGGSARIPAGSDGKHDVYLESTCIGQSPIIFTSALTAAGSVHLTIPDSFTPTATGKDLITSTAVTGANFNSSVAKFCVGKQRSTYQTSISVTTNTGTALAKLVRDSSYVSAGNKTFSGTAITGSGVFISGRSLTIPSIIACDHECTQGEYEQFCRYLNSSKTPSSSYGVGTYYPAYYVSWYDAIVYCNLRSIAEGLTPVYSVGGKTNPTEWGSILGNATTGYCASSACEWSVTITRTNNGWRLPYEAEWEYLARDGNLSNSGQYKYSGSNTMNDVSWNETNAGGTTHEVKTKNATPTLKMYDMTGNVWEWCNDWYAAPLSSSTAFTGPTSGTDGARQARHSGFPQQNELSYRNSGSVPGARNNDLGFRVVRTVVE